LPAGLSPCISAAKLWHRIQGIKWSWKNGNVFLHMSRKHAGTRPAPAERGPKGNKFFKNLLMIEKLADAP
jgi:hypothetical protein